MNIEYLKCGMYKKQPQVKIINEAIPFQKKLEPITQCLCGYELEYKIFNTAKGNNIICPNCKSVYTKL